MSKAEKDRWDELEKEFNKPSYDELRAENQRLRDELEKCQKDAERYRMARSGKCDIELCEFNDEDGEFYSISLIGKDSFDGNYADQVIDAAIAAQKEDSCSCSTDNLNWDVSVTSST